MSNYSGGRTFEHEVRADLRARGADEVLRSAGSKTKLDLVALWPGVVYFVQCKRDGKMDKEEWDRLLYLAELVGAIPVFAYRGARGQGIQYVRLLGPKVPRARTQPVEKLALPERKELVA